jgi:hypothetical protein
MHERDAESQPGAKHRSDGHLDAYLRPAAHTD